MSSSVIGITLKIISVALLISLGALIKAYPDDIPLTEIVFIRVLIALPFLWGFVFFFEKKGTRLASLAPKNIKLHLKRALIGMLAMCSMFLSFRLIPLPIASALIELSPIFITIFAVIFLGEKIRIYRTIGLGLGIIGVVFVSFEAIQLADFNAGIYNPLWGALAAITSAILASIVSIHIRTMVKTEHPNAVVNWFFIFTSLTMLFFAPFGWEMPEKHALPYIIGIGLTGGLGQLLMTMANQYSEASSLAPFQYFAILFSLIIGYLFFDELPSLAAFIGIIFILAGGLIIIYRENQLSKERST